MRQPNERKTMIRIKPLLFVGVWLVCAAAAAGAQPKKKGVINAGFVCVEKVYNSELMAPYDIFQHTYYRDDQNYMRCFIVTPDGKPFVTFEGIRITPDYSIENAPPIDVLVIPSTETSMSDDLENEKLMSYLKKAVEEASYVVTVCDGAFPLAATGALDGRKATTFPSDRDKMQEMFPDVDVRHDVNLVADGKYITSVGGALSYEPALYLVQLIYSLENAKRVGKGLVLDWNLDDIPHLIVGEENP